MNEQIIPIHVKGNCSDDWARMATTRAVAKVVMDLSQVERVHLVVDRVINIIPKEYT